MQSSDGDKYVCRLAAFIRTNETKLALPPFLRPKQTSTWLPLYSLAHSVVLSLDFFHLNYILVRLEAVGLDVGPLDVHVNTPFHPKNYLGLHLPRDRSDVLSLASFRSSISAITSLSLPSYWWNRRNSDSVDHDLKYIYSCFTKLPAVSIKAPYLDSVAELAGNLTDMKALPLHIFKNIQSLECADFDPRILIGWDRLAESLRSLKISRGGVDDFSEIFIGPRAIINDQTCQSHACNCERTSHRSNFVSNNSLSGGSTAQRTLADGRLKWAFLRYLSLRDNAITFFPVNVISCMTSLTHLDLSSNLLVSVPPGLDALHNLISMDLSDNMIDTIVGIHMQLGRVRTLNLSKNRLETICGLERLSALEHIDLRHNIIQESAEIGRLSVLSNIAEVWVDGNVFVEHEESYRLDCLEYFWREGKMVQLDGALPNLYERTRLGLRAPEQASIRRFLSGSPQTDVGQPGEALEGARSPVFGSKTGPVELMAFNKANSQIKRKKGRRVVQLDQRDEARPTNHKGNAYDILLLLDRSDIQVPAFDELSRPPREYVRHSRIQTDILSPHNVVPSGRKDDPFLPQRSANYSDNREGDGEKLRARIEALRRDMGEGWLTVLSSQAGLIS